jgi:hypothetical protein
VDTDQIISSLPEATERKVLATIFLETGDTIQMKYTKQICLE